MSVALRLSPILVSGLRSWAQLRANFLVLQSEELLLRQNMYLNRLTLIGFTCSDAETKRATADKTSQCSQAQPGGLGGTSTLGIMDRMAPLCRLREARPIRRDSPDRLPRSGRRANSAAATTKKTGLNHRSLECRVESILKLDRAVPSEGPYSDTDLEL